MGFDIKTLAYEWITYSRCVSDEVPDQIFSGGWALYDLVEDDALLAWEVIKAVVRHYPEDDYLSFDETEARRVVGHLAAGPLEDLLSTRASDFIGVVEEEARQDRRMAWALGGVWQSGQPSDLWARVEQVTDYSFRRTANGS